MKSVIILLVSLLIRQALPAQIPRFEKAAPLSSTALPSSPDEKGVCGSPVLARPEVRAQALENTRLFAPDVYMRMMASIQSPLHKETAPGDSVGQVRSFYVYNFKSQQYYGVSALLLSIGRTTEIWVDTAELVNKHVTLVEVGEIRNALENATSVFSHDPSKGIVPLEEEFFGKTPNINTKGVRDGGDGRTLFLITDIQDGWDSTSTGGFVAGFFSPEDQQVGSGGSNKCDMLYIDSYPGIYFSGTRDARRPLSTLAHEFQHLIHYRYDQDEETWVNEGLSEYAEVAAGFALRSPDKYFANTNTGLKTWRATTDSDVLADYSRVALWTLYCAEQNGDEFIRQLVQNPAHGTSGFNAAVLLAKAPYPFATIFENWLIANSVNDRSISPAYGYVYPVTGTPAPINPSLTNPSVSASSPVLKPLSALYFYYAFIDSLTVEFRSTGSNLAGDRIQYDTGGTRIGALAFNTPITEFLSGPTAYQRTYILRNTNEAEYTGLGCSAGGVGSFVSTELKYDNGKPTPFSGGSSFFGFGNGHPGRGWAVGFTPQNPLNRLVGLRLYVAFDNEFSNGTASDELPKMFDVHVWGDNNGAPGNDLITPFTLTIARQSFPDDFVTVSLMPYATSLSDLSGPVYIGFTQPGSVLDSVGVYCALSNATADNHTFGLIDPVNARWRAMPAINTSSGVSLAGYNMMMRALFLYRQKEVTSTGGIVEDVGQSYPNPFRSAVSSTVQIPYTATPAAHVVIDIFTMLGERVRRLETDAPPSGKGVITWDGRNGTGKTVASGVYLYRMMNVAGNPAGKMVVIE